MLLGKSFLHCLLSAAVVSAAALKDLSSMKKRDDAPKTCDYKQRLEYINKGLFDTVRMVSSGGAVSFNYWSDQAWINYNIVESLVNAYTLYSDTVFKDFGDNSNMIASVVSNDCNNNVVNTLWNGHYGEAGSDDHGWRILMALALHNYNVKFGKKDKWLDKAKQKFDDHLEGYWDYDGYGGVFWKEKKSGYRATISTELYLSIAAMIYDADNSADKYLKYAVQAFDWLFTFGVKSSDGIFGDGYHVVNGAVQISDKEYYTYNQGTLLSGLGLLYKHTQNETYLQSGLDLIGRVFMSGAMTDGLVLADTCDTQTITDLKNKNAGTSSKISYCSADRSYFKGTFMKHITYFFNIIPKEKSDPFRNFIQANANAAWGAALNSDKNSFNNVWIGQDVDGYNKLSHGHDGPANGMVFDAVVASIDWGNSYGCS